MKKKVVYHFQTMNGNHYIYDGCSNKTYPANQIDVEYLDVFDGMNLPPDCEHKIKLLYL